MIIPLFYSSSSFSYRDSKAKTSLKREAYKAFNHFQELLVANDSTAESTFSSFIVKMWPKVAKKVGLIALAVDNQE